MRPLRHVKAAVITALATAACHTVLATGFSRARAQETAESSWAALPGMAAGFLLSCALMPLLLWAGMRLLGERRIFPLFLGCGALWVLLVLLYVDDVDRPSGHMPVLALVLFVAAGALLGGAGAARDGGRGAGNG
ncbi:hypothetical protein [Streptomyces sp. NPDC057554]|uniref:hypothetical protein n=1 Tax=Streptomyces sp. NPDC057554 TaxID=3350538 RepID=UPI0036AB776E